jgi:O-antigen/teichoic acid export membrane protein
MSGGIARGSLINLVTRLAAVGLGLAITLYVARLGPAFQGAFALFTAVESVLMALTSGFGVAIARRISHHGERPAGLVAASLLACGLLGLIAAGALLLVSQQGPPAGLAQPLHLPGGAAPQAGSYESLRLLALAAPLLFITPNLSGLWLGSGRMGGLARLTLAAPSFTLLVIGAAALAGRPAALTTALGGWVAARIVVALGALLAAGRDSWLGPPDGRALAAEARFVLLIGATNLVSLLNYKIDIFLVERFLGLGPTGVYSIAVMAAELLWLVSSSVTTAAYARIGSPDAAAATRLTLRAMHASVLLLLALCPLVWGAAALLIPRLLGAAYAEVLPALALLLPGVALYGAASALSAWFTNHAGRPLVPALLALASLVFTVVVSLLAIPVLGMLGGALATSLSYVATMALGGWLFMRASGCSLAELLLPDHQALAADLGRIGAVLGGRWRALRQRLP